MPAGITVYNPGSTVQVDDNYKNLAVKSRFTRTSVEGSPYVRSFIRVQFASPFPFIAVTCASPITLVSSSRVSATSWAFDFVLDAPIGTPATFYTFGDPGTGGTLGLQLFNGATQMTFNSNEVYANIIDSLAAADYLSLVGTRSYSSSQLAVVFGCLSGWSMAGANGAPGSDFSVYVEEKQALGARVSGASVVLAVQPYWLFTQEQATPPFPNQYFYQKRAQVMVLDVSRANAKIPLT
ncbi:MULTISPECIES: hypothetical protein [unclassified Pseudomonas]|uniref:hypothetical protein n=1 Tax=unclassified Pseudomonas TaxID=196821 RepID=UPI0038285B39